jgi:predicted ferric reductase
MTGVSIHLSKGKTVSPSEAKQSLSLTVWIAGGTGILPVILNRQAGSLSHHSLLAMTNNQQLPLLSE